MTILIVSLRPRFLPRARRPAARRARTFLKTASGALRIPDRHALPARAPARALRLADRHHFAGRRRARHFRADRGAVGDERLSGGPAPAPARFQPTRDGGKLQRRGLRSGAADEADNRARRSRGGRALCFLAGDGGFDQRRGSAGLRGGRSTARGGGGEQPGADRAEADADGGRPRRAETDLSGDRRRQRRQAQREASRRDYRRLARAGVGDPGGRPDGAHLARQPGRRNRRAAASALRGRRAVSFGDVPVRFLADLRFAQGRARAARRRSAARKRPRGAGAQPVRRARDRGPYRAGSRAPASR